ncbi:putative bifunctional diguanylate cyclase/phosphodiesterase [Sphingomonas adhaesiva]|uniref:putative bifunctional diguanylate cyclase/phosphodiesterase n=1 Tax=Sphingomonas adhaesiva TaxID=28212 RepID=UPI002FF6E51C
MRRGGTWLILAVVALLGALSLLPAIGGPLDRALDPLRYGIQQHAASGDVVIVEMDARSVAAIRRWPWPRGHYATVVDRLRAAGAATIAFDVDFSTPSDATQDGRLATALARADGRVTLPTFAQSAGAGDRRNLDALPLPAFRAHSSLTSVSIAPDADGLVRAMPFATVTAGVPRPSLSAYLAARAGVADTTFPIDVAIDPDTIPRLSFVAVERGAFDPAIVRGRNILIGATAIEMGDRYPIPLRGVLPGVTIQALATETLLAGTPVRGSALLPVALALLLALAIARARGNGQVAARYAIALAAQGAIVLAAQHWLALLYPLAPGLVMLTAAAALAAIRNVARRLHDGRLTDEATGLPNRRAFVASARAVAVVQISNLDTLAAVLGGDLVAQAIVRTAERLRLGAEANAVFRVASDQLAFALPDDQPVEDMAAALRAILLEPVEVAGRKVDVAVAVGIAERGDLTAAALAAGTAAGEGRFWTLSAIDRTSLEREISLMGELDRAIEDGEILVHYQPKLALATGRVASVEALVRWRHPARGLVRPDLFIPLAEQTDRIAPLTLHVLRQVIRDVRRWRDAGQAMTAAVNISARLLTSPAFATAVDEILDAAIVPAEALIFEVTESAAIADTDAAVAMLRHFRDRGIAISMDDYGTGQSTLSYLRELPLSELKIDRKFVQFAHQREDDATLVRSTIDLAHALDLRVVAEGIEDAANLAFLKACGCDYAQGYFVARPMGYDDLLAFVTSAARRAA